MTAWYLSRFFAFFLAFAITAALMPIFIACMRRMKMGQAVREEGPQSHLSKEGTPTMGGVVLLFAIVAASLALLGSSPSPRLGGELIDTPVALPALLPLVALVAFGLIGFIDDYPKATRGVSLGLTMWQKFAAQFGISIAFVVLLSLVDPQFDTAISAFGRTFVLGWLYWPFAVLLMVAMTNAVNITDGLDGLVAGLVAIAAAALLAMPFLINHVHVPVVLAAAVGACAAFLWFNANPARIFMGDTGSLALGGFLAAVAIQTGREIPLIIVGLVFVIESVTVVMQVGYFKYTKWRYGEGRRIWKMAPLHHHYELKGWPEQSVVVRFWILGLLFAIIGVLSAGQWQGWLRY